MLILRFLRDDNDDEWRLSSDGRHIGCLYTRSAKIKGKSWNNLIYLDCTTLFFSCCCSSFVYILISCFMRNIETFMLVTIFVKWSYQSNIGWHSFWQGLEPFYGQLQYIVIVLSSLKTSMDKSIAIYWIFKCNNDNQWTIYSCSLSLRLWHEWFALEYLDIALAVYKT